MGTPLGEKGDQPVKWSRPAGVNLETHQFAPLTLDSSGDYILANLTDDFFAGVLENKPRTGEGGASIISGMPKARAGNGGVTIGRYVSVESGFFVAAVSGGIAAAKAWSTAASGAIFTAQLLDAGHTMTTSAI